MKMKEGQYEWKYEKQADSGSEKMIKGQYNETVVQLIMRTMIEQSNDNIINNINEMTMKKSNN